MPDKDEVEGKTYCKYHNSWSHNIVDCFTFRSILLDNIKKGGIRFPDEQESMVIDKDSFPVVTIVSINIIGPNLRSLLNQKREGRKIPPTP